MWASLVLELERTCILLLPLMPVTVPGRLMSECRRELRLAFSGGDCNTYRKRDPRSEHVNHTHQRELESTPFNVTAKTTLDYLQDANSFANPHVQYPIIALDNIRNKKKYLCRSGSVFLFAVCSIELRCRFMYKFSFHLLAVCCIKLK